MDSELIMVRRSVKFAITAITLVTACETVRVDPGTRLDYQLTATPVGSFAALGEGEIDPGAIEFGPSIGFPEPRSVFVSDLNAISRGCFVVIQASNGAFCERTTASTCNAHVEIDGKEVAPIENGSPSILAFDTFVFDDGEHELDLRDPSGEILIARITFEITSPILGGDAPSCGEE